MKVTNRANLPAALVTAIENDPYTKQGSDFSATELLQPPRIWALKKQNPELLVDDAEDRLWSLYGQIAHLILERANEADLCEKRFFATFDGKTVSAQVDTLSLKDGTLSDWKFSTAYKFKPNERASDDWVAQLNIQAELLRQNGLYAKKLQIIGLIRDFSVREARDNKNYPQSSVVTIPIPMWDQEITQAFIKFRIKELLSALENLPECSDEDRWSRPHKWAVMKKGNKRAVRLHDTEDSAMLHAQTAKDLFVEFRRGESVRCALYCPVSAFCTQYQNQNKEKGE